MYYTIYVQKDQDLALNAFLHAIGNQYSLTNDIYLCHYVFSSVDVVQVNWVSIFCMF